MNKDMDLNRLKKFSAPGNEIPKTWNCIYCGKDNFKPARFCGGCGKAFLAILRRDKTESQHDFSDNLPKIEPRIQPEPSPTLKKSTKEKDFIARQLTNLQKHYPRLKKQGQQLKQKVVKELKKIPRKQMAVLIFLLVCLFASLAYRTFNSGVEPEKTPTWEQFRAHLSRNLELSHRELDEIFKRTFAIAPTEENKIALEQAIKIESSLKNKLNNDEMSIFPNPFFSYMKNGAGKFLFTDVPLDHPVYEALAPLLELGINCGNKDMEIKPYEPIQWSDWKKINKDLLVLLEMDKGLIDQLAYNKKGIMSNIELNKFLVNLNHSFGIQKPGAYFWSQSNFQPSRLEALAALSSVIKALEN